LPVFVTSATDRWLPIWRQLGVQDDGTADLARAAGEGVSNVSAVFGARSML